MSLADERLDATFTALADPTRRAIVAHLARGGRHGERLAAPFAMTLPAISKHLKVLERCGLISRTRRAQFRPCHLEADVLDESMTGSSEPSDLDRALRPARRAPARHPAGGVPGRDEGPTTEGKQPA